MCINTITIMFMNSTKVELKTDISEKKKEKTFYIQIN